MLILNVITILTSFTIGSLAQEVCHVQGRCEEGYILNNTLADTYYDCQDACNSTDNCNFFTHEQTGDLCQLLSNCSQVISSLCSTCYTGEKDCPKVICSQVGLCQGELVTDLYTDTEDECLEKCVNEDDCDWYTYYESVRFCQLTSTCDPVSSASSVFGQRECYFNNQTDSSQ